MNFIGIILGFASLSTLLIVQSISLANIPTTTVVCPYGMCNPVVCALRIKPKPSNDEETITVNPVRVDLL